MIVKMEGIGKTLLETACDYFTNYQMDYKRNLMSAYCFVHVVVLVWSGQIYTTVVR